MILVKINAGFRVTLPKEFREKLKIKVGDLVEVELVDNQIVLKPQKRSDERATRRR
jgi:AbrB family looped-hinge helix DNA binding protein